MNEKLNLLRRKKMGKSKVESLKNLLTNLSFENPNWIDLESSDKILNKLKIVFSVLPNENEMISGESTSFIDSDLIRDIYLELSDSSLSYIFTDDFNVCGLFLVKAKSAMEQVLNIAKKDADNTCFILDHDFLYYLRVNYYDKSHSDNPNSYDIQRTIKVNF